MIRFKGIILQLCRFAYVLLLIITSETTTVDIDQLQAPLVLFMTLIKHRFQISLLAFTFIAIFSAVQKDLTKKQVVIEISIHIVMIFGKKETWGNASCVHVRKFHINKRLRFRMNTSNG